MTERIKTAWKRLACRHAWEKKAEFKSHDGSGSVIRRYVCRKCGKCTYKDSRKDGIAARQEAGIE